MENFVFQSYVPRKINTARWKKSCLVMKGDMEGGVNKIQFL